MIHTTANIKLEQLRHEADTYRQLGEIRSRDLAKLRSALQAILEIAQHWSFGPTEHARKLERKAI